MSTTIYLRELEIWQSKLAGLRQENAKLKIRLSELVDRSVLTDFLKKAEFFHNEFLANDESIRLIMDTVKHQFSTIKKGKLTSENDIKMNRERLQLMVQKFEIRFASIQDQFNREMASSVVI